MDVATIGLFLIGSCIGSFLNVVILRYCESLSGQKKPFQIHGRSHCPRCQRQLRWWELVPILSFVLLRGRCARCHTAISVQYPLVELAMGLLVVTLATPLPITMMEVYVLIFKSTIAALLVVLFMIDLKTMLLPDMFVGLLLGVVALGQAITYYLSPSTYNLNDALYGVVIGAGFLMFLWIITRGRGIGLGDVKLMFPIGVWAGLWGSVALLFIAYLVGGAVAFYLLGRRRATLKSAMPFGPFLCGAALSLLVFPAFPEQLLTLILGYNPFL